MQIFAIDIVDTIVTVDNLIISIFSFMILFFIVIELLISVRNSSLSRKRQRARTEKKLKNCEQLEIEM